MCHSPCQLWNVAGNFAAFVELDLLIELLNLLAEVGELRDDKLVLEGPGQERGVGADHPLELVAVQGQALYRDVGEHLLAQGLQVGDHLLETAVRSPDAWKGIMRQWGNIPQYFITRSSQEVLRGGLM